MNEHNKSVCDAISDQRPEWGVCPTCHPVIACKVPATSKSVEKRLAIQSESDYDRGFRHGMANAEANLAANAAANERLRREHREDAMELIKLREEVKVLKRLYKESFGSCV